MRIAGVLAVVRPSIVASGVLSLASGALAEETTPTVDVPKKAPRSPAPRETTSGATVLTLAGYVGVLDPGAGAREPDVGGGAGFQILLRRLEWPVFVGFGAGILFFDASTRTETTRGVTLRDGNIGYEVTNEVFLDHTAELRHAELLLRFQPYWGIVRPYVEGLVGLGGVWETVSRPEVSGERSVGTAGLFGAMLGIDWRLHSWGAERTGKWDLILTTGVQRLFTTAVTRPTFDGLGRPATHHDPLKMWVPFLGIGLAGKSETAVWE